METSRIERESMRRRQVEEFLASEMSTAQWAPLNGMSVSNLRYWIRKYKGDNQASSAWVDIAKAAQNGTAIVPAAKTDAAAITVKVGAVSIEVRPGFDENLLKSVINIATSL